MNWLRVFPALTVLICLSQSVTVADDRKVRADAVQEARRAIQARYDQFDRAYMRKDFNTLAGVFTPECILTLESEGRSMKASRLTVEMKVLSQNLTVSQVKTRILSVKPTTHGYDVAAVWIGYSNYAPKQKTMDDPARRSWTRQNVRDTWQRTDKGWQIGRRVIIEPHDDAKTKTAP